MTVDLAELTKPFPKEAIKQRQGGGGRSFDYVPGHTVIHRLNAATENQWSFRVIDITTRTITTQRDGRTFESTLMTATVELDIHGLGARQHMGVQMVNDSGGEDLVKGAITDALKKAATLFGVGLELYGPDVESGELPVQRPQHAPQASVRPDTRRYPQAADAALADAQTSAQSVIAPPRQMNPANADEPATAPQVKAVFAIGRKLDIDVKPWIATQYGGRDIDSLTRSEASLLIEGWQSELETRSVPV